jgi:hypothetical protein
LEVRKNTVSTKKTLAGSKRLFVVFFFLDGYWVFYLSTSAHRCSVKAPNDLISEAAAYLQCIPHAPAVTVLLAALNNLS